MFPYIKYVIWTLLFTATISIASESKFNRYSESLTYQKNSTVFLLPLSAPELGPMLNEADSINAELISQIQKLGHQVDIGNEEWIDATRTLRHHVQYWSDAESVQITEESMAAIAQEMDSDIIILPTLLERQAKLKYRSAKWDGTKQRVIYKGRGKNKRWEGSGSTTAISLRLNAYNSNGQWLFTTYGGMALPFYVDLNQESYVLKDIIFSDADFVKEGIENALEGFNKVTAY